MIASTERFSNRVDNYVKYRPGYPAEITNFLKETVGLRKRFLIADIGSGTGIFSELFLKQGYRVKAVEPNRHMREAAEKNLRNYRSFTSIDGTAEHTCIADASIDLITAAQAFHWFSAPTAKAEFMRILRPGGSVLLVWNIRKTNTEFLSAYEELKCNYQTDRNTFNRNDEAAMEAFLKPLKLIVKKIDHEELLNFDHLKGQLLSSSYIPLEGSPGYDTMVNELEILFNMHQEDGLVKIAYDTMLYLGVS